jgi:hypothetical protein
MFNTFRAAPQRVATLRAAPQRFATPRIASHRNATFFLKKQIKERT